MDMITINLDFIHFPIEEENYLYVLFVPEEVQRRYPELRNRHNIYTKLNPFLLSNLIQRGWNFN